MQSEGNQNTDQQEQGTGPWNLRKIHPGLWVGDLKMATRAVSEGDGAFSGILSLCGTESRVYKEGIGQGLPFVLHRSTRLGNVDERYFALKSVDFLEDSLQSLFSDPLKAAMVFLIEVCVGDWGGSSG